MKTKSASLRIASKCLPAACLLLVSFSGIRAQNVVPDDPDGPYGIPTVKRALEDRFPPPGAMFKVTEKPLNWLGDRASIALIKLVDDEDFKNKQKVIRVLQIIRHAFVDAKIIRMQEDKKPKFTLIFLEHLEAVLKDPALKREVSEVRRFVVAQTTTPKTMK
jgi:hypothetical protein